LAVSLTGCDTEAGKRTIIYQGSDYRLLTGPRLKAAIVGSTLVFDFGEVVSSGGNWERFGAQGTCLRQADLVGV